MTSEDNPTVYLAGAIRDAPDNGREWRNRVEREYGDEFTFLNPLERHDPSEFAPGGPTPPGYVVEDDKEEIRRSDVMLVRWYINRDIDTEGTPMEIMHAHDVAGIPIVVWLDSQFVEREKVSGWIYHHTNGVVTVLDDAMFSLKSFVDSGLTNGLSATERAEIIHGGVGDGAAPSDTSEEGR